MIYFDLKTLSFLSAFSNFAFALLTAIYIKISTKRNTALEVWCAAKIVISFGFCINLLQAQFSAVIPSMLGNCFQLLGFIIELAAYCILLEYTLYKSLLISYAVVGLVIYFGLDWCSASENTRLIVASILMGWVSVIMAALLLRPKWQSTTSNIDNGLSEGENIKNIPIPQTNTLAKIIGLIDAALGVMLFARAARGLFFEPLVRFNNDPVNTILYFTGFIVIIVNGFGFLLLSKQKDDYNLRQALNELRFIAFHDPLTRLPNRRLLLERMEQALLTSERNSSYIAVLFLDLNKFKQLNDTYGHHVGDQLLIEVAQRLEHCLGSLLSACVARMGGDEFIVLLEGLGKNLEQATQQASRIAENINLALREEYIMGHIHHEGSASIGMKLFIGSDQHPNTIIQEADAAMYQMKKQSYKPS